LVAPSGPERRPDERSGLPGGAPKDSGSLSYEPAFGLFEKPFSLSPDPRFFFGSSTHSATFDALVSGIRRREGILALTGEVGTGKTTLCRAVLQSLDRKTFAAFVADPFLSREDLLKTLLVEFGVVSVDDIRSGRLRHTSRTELSYTLYEFLTSLQPLQAFAVVILDEAQNLETRLLEEIRILSDLENGHKLIQLVLVGQPELQMRLGKPEMRQLTQRLSVRCELPPLARNDVGPYVSHRLGVAGNNETLSFTDAAIGLVHAVSSGIPRVINLVCDRALGRVARTGKMRVDTEHVLGALDDLGLHVPRNLRTVPSDRPRPTEKSGDSASPPASEWVEERHPHPQVQAENSSPVVDLTVNRTSGLNGESTLRGERVLGGNAPGPNLQARGAEVRDAAAEVESHESEAALGKESLPADDPDLDKTDEVTSATESSPFNDPQSSDWDRPGPDLESLDWDLEATSAGHGKQRHQPLSLRGESFPATGPIAGIPVGSIRATERSVSARRTSSSGGSRNARVRSFPEEAAGVAWGQDIAARQPRRRRWRLFGVLLLLLTTAAIGYRYWLSVKPLRPQDAQTRPADPLVPSELASPGTPAPVLAPPGEGQSAGAGNVVPGPNQTAKFVVRMATFESPVRATRAVEELQGAGYRAYSTDVTFQDGRPGIAVFLGRYADLAQAERDFERARQIPGYETARIVQLGPPQLTAKPGS
jgi:type II secretory pathway predicted ATPase ExeA